MQSLAQRNGHTAQIKVKSGCITCRARRIRCDKLFPVCIRCIASSRVCEGYGIWGGGGNLGAERNHNRPTVKPGQVGSATPLPPGISPSTGSLEEKEYFHWFKCRTSVKLPGSFLSNFWSTLLFQASFGEPAVLHAVLALASVHRRGILLHEGANSVPDARMEHFTLLQYSKAINDLRPHFSIKDRASFRVVLVSCLVFLSLDLLRGHISSANIHLQNGLKLLEEIQWNPGSVSKVKDTILRPLRETIDDWVVEIFTRLQAHSALFGHLFLGSGSYSRATNESGPRSNFCSLKEAWNDLDKILMHIIHMTEQTRKLENTSSPVETLPLSSSQPRIQEDLSSWHATYETSREIFQEQATAEEIKAYQLLSICHNMATIMATTSTCPNDEMIYDTLTDHFISLIKQLIDIRASQPYDQVPKRHHLNMSSSIIDIGWIPPLYYIAVKCRIHRIRLQAVRLLETTSHREGMWDSHIAGVVARRAMEFEERDFYRGMNLDDNFDTSSYPTIGNCLAPPLPTAYRLQRLQVVLLGGPLEKVLLLSERELGGLKTKVCLDQYYVGLERWASECVVVNSVQYVL